MFDETALNRRTQIPAATTSPLQGKVANGNRIRFDEFSNCDYCLPTWTDTTLRFPTGKHSFRLGDYSLNFSFVRHNGTHQPPGTRRLIRIVKTPAACPVGWMR